MHTKELSVSCLYSGDPRYQGSIANHPDFIYMASTIGELRQNRENVNALNEGIRSIKNILSRMFGGVEFEMTIVNNDFNANFFVCNVFPPRDVCMRINNLIIQEDKNQISVIRKVWDGIGIWHIDIDSRVLFDRSMTAFTNSEIAALIIYNIERITMSYVVPNEVNYIVNMAFYNRSYTVNKLARSRMCSKLFVLPFFNACMFKTYPVHTTQFIEGTCFEDSSMFEIYSSAVTRIITTVGNETIDRDSNALRADIRSTCDWIFACIVDLKYSYRLLKETLGRVVLSQSSYYVKNVIVDILTTFGVYDREDIVSLESANNPTRGRQLQQNPEALQFAVDSREQNGRRELLKEFARIEESFMDLFDSIGAMKKVSQKDIDYIRLNAQKIETVDDKLFIMDDVHRQLEIVEASLLLLDSKDPMKIKKVRMSKQALLDAKKQLAEIRDSIVKMPIAERNPRRILVTYPKGYEG